MPIATRLLRVGALGLPLALATIGCGGGDASSGNPEMTVTPALEAPSTSSPEASSPAPSVGSPSVAPTLAVTWTPFTSKRFAYSIEYPEDWLVTEAAADWPEVGWPAPDGNAVDRFARSSDAAQVTISSDTLAAGEVAAGRRAEIDQETALACKISGRATVAIDGADAKREDELCFGKDHIIDVFVEHGGRIYLIDWLAKAETTEGDRALFDAMLARFRFGG
jgi:hypothetical protein